MRLGRYLPDGVHLPIPLPAGLTLMPISQRIPADLLHPGVLKCFQGGLVAHIIRIVRRHLRPVGQSPAKLHRLGGFGRAGIDRLRRSVPFTFDLMLVHIKGHRVIHQQQIQQPADIRRGAAVRRNSRVLLLRQFQKTLLVVGAQAAVQFFADLKDVQLIKIKLRRLAMRFLKPPDRFLVQEFLRLVRQLIWNHFLCRHPVPPSSFAPSRPAAHDTIACPSCTPLRCP